MDTPAPFSFRRFAAAAVPPVVLFLASVVPQIPSGPITGTGQDEWYNVVRGLTVLYERLDPSYFIHPALYYELLALLYAVDRALLAIAGTIGGGSLYLDYFLAHQEHFLFLARGASVFFGALAVLAGVWLGTLLAGAGGGLLAGLLVASLPLLQTMAIAIRVDTLGLATWLGAAALVVRAYQDSDRNTLVFACIGIGIAAAANYPGALLLLVFGWFVHLQDGDPRRTARRFAAGSAVAGAAFVALNPYVLIDLRTFVAWFTFQVGVAFATHPFGQEPSPTHYLDLLHAQGFPALLACLGGAAAALTPREPGGALASLGLTYLAVFSALRSQYDRFALPSIALLCVTGAAWICLRLACRIGPRIAAGFAVVTAVALVWSVAAHDHSSEQPSLSPDTDYRAEMFDWIRANVPPSATLVFESDTLPLLQTVFAPGNEGGPFHRAILEAFQRTHPTLPRRMVKAQFIGTVYNYDAQLLTDGEVFFLGTSQNRQYIADHRTTLPQPAAFYDALDAGAAVAHESGGVHERLTLYAVRRE